jgi:hypothetical protein
MPSFGLSTRSRQIILSVHLHDGTKNYRLRPRLVRGPVLEREDGSLLMTKTRIDPNCGPFEAALGLLLIVGDLFQTVRLSRFLSAF